MLWSALGSRHDLTARHVEGSRTGAEVALESLVAGSVGTGELEGGRGAGGRNKGEKGTRRYTCTCMYT